MSVHTGTGKGGGRSGCKRRTRHRRGMLLIGVTILSPRSTTLPPPPQPISSSDENGQGTPAKSLSPISISTSTQRELEADLVLCSSPARGGESPDLLPQSLEGWTTWPPPSSLGGSLSGPGSKVGSRTSHTSHP